MMIFSIIIPHYRDYERLLLLLKRLNDQVIEENTFEVIVVNNDSELPNLEIDVTQFKFRLLLTNELIPGSYAARNKGIQLAKGKIIGFTDSDCLPSPEWLKNALEVFSKDLSNEIGILTGPVSLFFQNDNKLSDTEIYEKYTGFTTKKYAGEGHAVTANWFSYKSILEEFGCFNEQLKSNGDSELSGKISKKYQIIYCENVLVNHPARYFTNDIVNKYKRLLGGTYTRRFQEDIIGFRFFLLNFIWRRYRFALNKIFKVRYFEFMALLRVCHAINIGAVQEYFNLIRGGETKR